MKDIDGVERVVIAVMPNGDIVTTTDPALMPKKRAAKHEKDGPEKEVPEEDK